MFALGVASRWGGRGGGRGEWGEWRSISSVFENSILLIKVQGYRGLTQKLKTVKAVHTLRYSVLRISEYFRGFFFCESFGINGAANLGIWCSAFLKIGFHDNTFFGFLELPNFKTKSMKSITRIIFCFLIMINILNRMFWKVDA